MQFYNVVPKRVEGDGKVPPLFLNQSYYICKAMAESSTQNIFHECLSVVCLFVDVDTKRLFYSLGLPDVIKYTFPWQIRLCYQKIARRIKKERLN